jgi:hypothetical protein
VSTELASETARADDVTQRHALVIAEREDAIARADSEQLARKAAEAEVGELRELLVAGEIRAVLAHVVSIVAEDGVAEALAASIEMTQRVMELGSSPKEGIVGPEQELQLDRNEVEPAPAPAPEPEPEPKPEPVSKPEPRSRRI